MDRIELRQSRSVGSQWGQSKLGSWSLEQIANI